MSRALRIALKDLRVTTRDRGALGVMVLMPVLLIVILGSALGGLAGGGGGFHVGIAIVNHDTGEAGARIADAFFTSADLKEVFSARRYASETAARTAVERGDLTGAIVIPAGFTDAIGAAGTKSATISVLTDPGRPVAAGVVAAVADSLSIRVSAAAVAARTTQETVQRVPFVNRSGLGALMAKAAREGASDRAAGLVSVSVTDAQRKRETSILDYYAVGMTAMFLLFGSMYGAFSVVRERQDWTLPRLLTTSATRPQIVGGKMLGIVVIGALQFGALWGFTAMLGVKWGAPAGVALVAICTLVAVAGLALLFATLGKTVRGVGGVAPLVIQVMAAVGGSFFPVASLPSWLQPVHYAAVNGWTIDAFLRLMRGGGVADVTAASAVLLGMGAVFFVIGATRLRWAS